MRPRASSSAWNFGAWFDMMTVLPVLTRLQAKPTVASLKSMMILSISSAASFSREASSKASGQ